MIREPMVGNIDAIAGALPLCGILTLPDISGKHGQDPMSILYSGSLWKLHTFGRLIPPSLLTTSVTVKSSGYIKERFARDVRHTSRDCFFFTRVLNSWAMTALLKKRTWDNHKREYSGTIRLEHMMRQLYGLLGITEDGGMKVARSY